MNDILKILNAYNVNVEGLLDTVKDLNTKQIIQTLEANLNEPLEGIAEIKLDDHDNVNINLSLTLEEFNWLLKKIKEAYENSN